jgi:hypothetical protein
MIEEVQSVPTEERSAAPPDAAGLTRDRLLLRALACALLALAVLRPPETYAWSGAVCSVLLAAAGCLAWLGAEGPPLPPAWTAGLLPLALVAVTAASCRARAFDEAGAALTLILAALLGRALARDTSGRDTVARILAVLGSIAAVLAVLQHHVTYPELLRGLATAADPPSPYVIARLQGGRPSGPFTLPAALGGFFALTLPLTLLLLRRRADRWQQGALLAAAVLQAYALVLTRSLGGLAAAAVSLVLSLPFLAPRRRGILLAAVPLAAVAIGFLFLQARRTEVDAPGGDPLLLRAGNWRAAAEMIRDHPLFGTGPGSFGTFYPRYLRPGMNETRYAHDSYLQVISGWGLWSIVPISGFLLAFATRLGRAWRRRAEDLPFAAAGAAFLAHNLIDFTAFLPGVAIPSALLVGMSFRPGDPMAEETPEASRRALNEARGPGLAKARGALAAAAMILFLGHALLSARSEILLREARSAATDGHQEDALALARRASRTRRGDPVPRAFIAEWVLAHGMNEEALRREGERQAERAVRLDPESAILHHDRSLYFRAAGETAQAAREQFSAHLLFPLRETYRPPQGMKDARIEP